MPESEWRKELRRLRKNGAAIFSDDQWRTVDKLIWMGMQAAMNRCDIEISKLRKEIDSLKDKKADSHNELRKREVFYVSDFANLLGVKSDTVNKNYVRTGLIDPKGKEGAKTIFSKEEYWRCHEDYAKFGKIKPKGMKG